MAQARRAVRTGLRRFEEHEALLGATELRVSAARRAAELADVGLEWAVQSGRPREILAWSERRRAASLRASPVRPPANGRLADLLAQRRAASFTAEQLARSGDLDAGPDPAAVRRVGTLDREIRALARATGAAPLAGATSAARPSDLVRALGGRALVALVALNDDVGAVSVVDGQFRFSTVASLSELVTELGFTHFGLARAVVGTSSTHDALVASITRLDQLVGAALASMIGSRPGVIVAPAVLHTLPFGALPSLARQPICVAPSATSWLRAESRQRVGAGRAVVIAGPDLEHAEDEARAVARLLGAPDPLVGAAATASAVIEAIDGAAVAHFACHGRYHRDNAAVFVVAPG